METQRRSSPILSKRLGRCLSDHNRVVDLHLWYYHHLSTSRELVQHADFVRVYLFAIRQLLRINDVAMHRVYGNN